MCNHPVCFFRLFIHPGAGKLSVCVKAQTANPNTTVDYCDMTIATVHDFKGSLGDFSRVVRRGIQWLS